MTILWPSLLETLTMVLLSSIFSLLLGFPLGIILVMSEKDGLRPNLVLNKVLNTVINIIRSIPFIILIVILFPLSKLITGTMIGTKATIIPLSLSATPFVARVIESSLKEVDPSLIELGLALGASNFEIIWRILIPEALPQIISNITLTVINLIGLSAMAGAVGGGGLGDLAIRYGYHGKQMDIMLYTVVIIVVLVQLVQLLGNRLARKLNKK